MGKVLQVTTSGGGQITKNFGANYAEAWVYVDVAFDTTGLANLLTNPGAFTEFDFLATQSSAFDDAGVEWYVDTGPTAKWAAWNDSSDPASTPFTPSPALAAMQFYRVKVHVLPGTPITEEVWVDGVSIGTVNGAGTSSANVRYLRLFQPGLTHGVLYFDNVKVGTTDGATDIFSDDFESGGLSNWTSTGPDFSVIDDPGITPADAVPPEGRVWIAFNDGPLEPSPTWTLIDQGTNGFPAGFVSGYDIEVGRQTLISQTDTGTATVYINDHDSSGLFDPRNVSSPYFGLLDGRQILLQLYDPVAAAWEDQFRGLIDDITWDIDGSAVGADGFPINANIQIECVDMFDYLAGYGLTPGLDGITPQTVPSGTAGGPVPTGMEDGVYYAETTGTVDDRFIEILTDAGVDSTRYTIASGNIHALAVKYDPDESALQGLRDAADAEFPFIANIYCDRHGNFQFRGRYSRFDPDAVAAEPGSTWDFTRWAAGDGAAIIADSTRAQLRTFSFGRNRSDLINVAYCYPQGMPPAQAPSQVYADTTSITAYGKHSAAPMSDLLTGDYAGPGTISPTTGTKQCALYAELLVKNQKDPRETITQLGFKSMQPDGSTRATKTWALITKADIAHIVNVAVGYPGGTGLAGASPDDDYYIEGRRLRVRVANASYDYVELDLDVSPAVWSMDTHSVFPPLA